MFAVREKECREREQRDRAEAGVAWGGSGWPGVARGGWGWLGRSWAQERKRAKTEPHDFGKWFTENFSVNRFPNFCEGFYGQTENIFC